MSEKRFELTKINPTVNPFDTVYFIIDYENPNKEIRTLKDCVDLLNEQDKEIGLLRLELDTHKHPLWSTREAERKLSEVTNNLANEVKKNGLLNEEINQLRIENMRLKKKGGDGI